MKFSIVTFVADRGVAHPAPEAVTLRRLDELAAVAESIEGG